MRDPLPGLLYRQHEKQLSSSQDWKEWRADDAVNPHLLEAYRALTASLRLSDDASPATLSFAMTARPPESVEGRATTLRLIENLQNAARRLSLADRFALDMRLRRARARLNA